MTQIISRLYASRENADAAVAELKKIGFANRVISVVTPPDAGATDDAPTRAAIKRAGIVDSHAAEYATGIKRGETLVSVAAPFGYAATAIGILDSNHPTQTGLGEQGYEKAPPDPAAPFSSACGWTVLSHNPTPLSSALGWKVLSDSRKPRKPDNELIDNPAPFSTALDQKVLFENPAPLSKRFGWGVLWDNAAPLSSRFGWRVLSREPNPPEKRLGLPLVSDDPAPLSSRIGWKTLSNNPAPLSSLFGWRVLSDEAPPRR